MTPEEYMNLRETLTRQFRRCKNNEDRGRLQAKIEKLDGSFKSRFYGRVIRTSRPENEQNLRVFEGV